MDIEKIIEKHRYAATEAQVEGLARSIADISTRVLTLSGTYLRVLAAECISKLGAKKRGPQPAVATQLTVVEAAYERYHEAVMRGVTTPDIAPVAVANGEPPDPGENSRRALERNRRSTFERSAKSTLVAYVRAGGDLRSIDVMTVTKFSLRAAIAPPEPADKLERTITRAEGILLRAIKRQAKADPAGAAARLAHAIETFQKALRGLGGAVATAQQAHAETSVTGVHKPPRTRVGVPQLHRGA